MRVERKIEDFVRSKYCKPTDYKITSIWIKDYHKYHDLYKDAEKKAGIGELRIICRGRTQLTNYLNSVIPDFLDILKGGEIIEVKFEDFTVYCFYYADLEKPWIKVKGVLLMTAAIAVILPRKTPLETYYGEVYVVDWLDHNFYILPQLVYPAKEEDLKRLCTWLRYKQSLVIRYKLSDEKCVRFRPGFSSFRFWEKKMIVMTKNSDIPPEYLKLIDDPKQNMAEDSPHFETVMDFRDNQIYTYADKSYNISPLPIKPVTQDMINEWMERERDRYEVCQ